MTNSNDPPPPFVAASDRNKQPILDQLQDLLPDDAQVLEIGSGWGQHAIHFCRAMPGLDWQPSDQAARIVELEEQLGAAALPGIRRPLTLDVLVDDWPAGPFDVVYSANTAHIMSWRAVCAMVSGTANVLSPGGLFCLYGPFNVEGKYTSDGNREFDRNLRKIDPERGLRDVKALEKQAGGCQMKPVGRIAMPANNLLLVFSRIAGGQDRDHD